MLSVPYMGLGQHGLSLWTRNDDFGLRDPSAICGEDLARKLRQQTWYLRCIVYPKKCTYVPFIGHREVIKQLIESRTGLCLLCLPRFMHERHKLAAGQTPQFKRHHFISATQIHFCGRTTCARISSLSAIHHGTYDYS